MWDTYCSGILREKRSIKITHLHHASYNKLIIWKALHSVQHNLKWSEACLCAQVSKLEKVIGSGRWQVDVHALLQVPITSEQILISLMHVPPAFISDSSCHRHYKHGKMYGLLIQPTLLFPMFFWCISTLTAFKTNSVRQRNVCVHEILVYEGMNTVHFDSLLSNEWLHLKDWAHQRECSL